MNFPDWLPVFGDTGFRDKKCPKEEVEQVTCFNWMRRHYPCLEQIAIHPKNEQKRKGGQFKALEKDKAMGFKTGASDIIIPASPGFVCELKRADHTLSKWQYGQVEYLQTAYYSGSFVCVALGHGGFQQALEYSHKKFFCNSKPVLDISELQR